MANDVASPASVQEARRSTPDALIVVYRQILSSQQRKDIGNALEKELERKVIVIDGDPRIYDAPTDARLASLEKLILKLNASMTTLLESIDSDDDEGGPTMDLDGNVAGKPRDPRTPL